MAKRTKTTARLGKVKKTTEKGEWKAIEAKTDVKQDPDSDNGSFMDDDTEDFLPAGWTGSSKGKNQNKVAPGLQQNIEVTATKTTQTKINLDITELEASLERMELRSVTIESERCTQVVAASPNIELAAQKAKTSEHSSSASETTVFKHIAALELGVSTTLVQGTTSQVEQLHELIHSLEQQLKSTRYQATATKAELESKITKQDAEVNCLRIELADRNALRAEQYLALKKEKDEIEANYRLRREHTEAQRIKATEDLGKLRNTHAELKTKNANLERQLASEKAKVTAAREEKDALRDERQRQEFTIRQLQKQVNQGNALLTQMREELNGTRVEKSNLMSEKSNLESELSSVRHRSTVASVSTSAQLSEVREAKEFVERKYEFLQMRCSILERNMQNLEHEAKDLIDEKNSLDKELDIMRNKLCKANTRVNRQEKSIKDLKSEVSDLERDRDLKAPILQIGVDIRLRNLEHAAGMVSKIPRAGWVDDAIIMNGNNAAHRANGAVDAALFQASLVPEDYLWIAEETFEEMYTVTPWEYGGWSPKVLRLIDCRATIKTVKPFRRNASLDLREEHSEIDSKLLELHDSMAQRAFETSKVVDDLIERLELLTTEIVEADRSRGGRH